jgi:molybdopterin converting factor small subunit
LQITLKTYSDLRKAIGRSEIVLDIGERNTLKDLISQLNDKYSERFREETGRNLKNELNHNFNVYLKGRLIYPSKYSVTKIQNQDEIIIMRPIGGGKNLT